MAKRFATGAESNDKVKDFEDGRKEERKKVPRGFELTLVMMGRNMTVMIWCA